MEYISDELLFEMDAMAFVRHFNLILKTLHMKPLEKEGKGSIQSEQNKVTFETWQDEEEQRETYEWLPLEGGLSSAVKKVNNEYGYPSYYVTVAYLRHGMANFDYAMTFVALAQKDGTYQNVISVGDSAHFTTVDHIVPYQTDGFGLDSIMKGLEKLDDFYLYDSIRNVFIRALNDLSPFWGEPQTKLAK